MAGARLSFSEKCAPPASGLAGCTDQAAGLLAGNDGIVYKYGFAVGRSVLQHRLISFQEMGGFPARLRRGEKTYSPVNVQIIHPSI